MKYLQSIFLEQASKGKQGFHVSTLKVHKLLQNVHIKGIRGLRREPDILKLGTKPIQESRWRVEVKYIGTKYIGHRKETVN